MNGRSISAANETAFYADFAALKAAFIRTVMPFWVFDDQDYASMGGTSITLYLPSIFSTI